MKSTRLLLVGLMCAALAGYSVGLHSAAGDIVKPKDCYAGDGTELACECTDTICPDCLAAQCDPPTYRMCLWKLKVKGAEEGQYLVTRDEDCGYQMICQPDCVIEGDCLPTDVIAGVEPGTFTQNVLVGSCPDGPVPN